MNNYQCAKCGVVIQSESTPLAASCPQGQGHRWENLGKVGNNNYQCSKCGMLVKSETWPVPLMCPQKNHSHSWKKL